MGEAGGGDRSRNPEGKRTSSRSQPRPSTAQAGSLCSPLLDLQLFELLERRIERPEYVGTLAEEQHKAQAPGGEPLSPGPRGGEVLQADWWELKSDGSMNTGRWQGSRQAVQSPSTHRAVLPCGSPLSLSPSSPSLLPCAVSEATGDYVFVEREDVVDALSAFIAAYVASLPDTRGMDPRQMQQAIAIAFQVSGWPSGGVGGVESPRAVDCGASHARLSL